MAKTMILVFHKEREYKVGKLKYKTLKVMQPGQKTNPVSEETILDQSTRRFTVVIDSNSPTFISQE